MRLAWAELRGMPRAMPKAVVAGCLALLFFACSGATAPSTGRGSGTRGTSGSGGGGTSGAGGGGTSGGPGVTPPGSYTVTFGPVTVPPGVEKTQCITVHLGNDAIFHAGTIHNTLGDASHHMIVYRVN